MFLQRIERPYRSLRGRALAVALVLLIGAAVAVTIERQWPRIGIWRLSRIAADAPGMLISGRLHQFSHGSRPVRGAASTHALALNAAAKGLAKSFASSGGGAGRHAAGVGLLLAGNARLAVSHLVRAAEQSPTDAVIWNDLAVARLNLYENEQDAPELLNALGAVDCALRADAELLEARFNRAWILEAMGMHAAAARAYAEYLEIDAHSAWATDARIRLRVVSEITRAEEWGKELARLRRLRASDREAIWQIVSKFPQDARATAETLFLEEWALATTRDESKAATSLQLAGVIGDVLVSISGETLLRDAVAAIVAERDSESRASIVDAVRKYVNGRRIYETRDVMAAKVLFESAASGFEQARHPMAALAQFYLACSLFDTNDSDGSLAILKRLEADVPLSHQVLHAFIQWEIGVVHARAGRFNEALMAQLRSLSAFERLGEESNANVIGSQAAGTQASLGRRVEAWRIRLAMFRRISRSGDAGDLQRAIDQAARAEAREDRWDNAFSLMTLAVDPTLQKNPRIRVSSLNWRALAAHRLGMESIALQDLAAARIASEEIPASAMRRRAKNEIMFCEAVTLRRENPPQAIALLSAYLREGPMSASASLTSEALLERGRAYVALDDDVRAVEDFRQALTIVRSEAIPANQLRDAYFRTAEAVARELAAALVRVGRVREALSVIESQRSCAYLAASAEHRLPARMSIHYLVLPDHLLIFTAHAGRLSVTRVEVTERQLEEEVEAFLLGLDREDDSDAGATLAARLIGPVATAIQRTSELIIVPDGVIARLPFGALPLDDRRMVVQQTAITISPSAAVAAEAEPSTTTVPQSVLTIGNPSFDRGLFAELELLPAAEREAVSIAKGYAHATVLVGAEATRRNVLDAFGSTDAIHIGTHAVVVPGAPARSHLILAPGEGDSGVLYLSDVERVALRRTRLVVVAACESAKPPEARRNVETLALAFVAAGAANAVGTLWSVDDIATEEFTTVLHREIRAGAGVAEAVRRAQLSMIVSPDPAIRLRRAWAAFQVYGSGK